MATDPTKHAAVDNPLWREALTEQDREVFARSGWGARAGFGARPALIVVDVNYNFVGEEPLPILESIDRWRNSCGEEAWRAVGEIARLLEVARASAIPVMYSTGGRNGRPNDLGPGRWKDKNSRHRGEQTVDPRGNEIVSEIAPQPGEVVFTKHKPSAFFGTALISHLTDLGADSLVVCGTTTSGCVRATVVDAFSYNYRVSVVSECTFDRGQASHAINMFDMDQKYADAVSLDETMQYFKSLNVDQ